MTYIHYMIKTSQVMYPNQCFPYRFISGETTDQITSTCLFHPYDTQSYMFWSTVIFCRHSTQKPTSPVCDNQQSDLFYSTVRTCTSRNNHKEKVGRGFGKNEDEWTGKVKIRIRRLFLTVGEASVAMF